MTLPSLQFFAMPTLLLCGAMTTTLFAADEYIESVRISPQLMVGTAGVEIGAAVEIRLGMWNSVNLRPEVFINDDADVGGGASALWTITDSFDFPARHGFQVGPRVVYHNSDEEGWELSALGMWSIALDDSRTRRHEIEILAALGVLQDREGDTQMVLAASGGAAYSYRF